MLPSTVRIPSRRAIILGSQAIVALALVVMLLQRTDMVPALPTLLPGAVPTAPVAPADAGSEPASSAAQPGADTTDATAQSPIVDVVSYASLVPVDSRLLPALGTTVSVLGFFSPPHVLLAENVRWR